jgi:hypothetical protein
MQILAKCPKCDAGLPIEASDAPATITCGGCGREMSLSVSDALRAGRAVDRCPVCDGSEFYARKDFDPKVGLTVVVIGALISAGFYWFGRDLIAYSILGAATLIDLAIYGRLKDLTVCYRCHSEFRGPFEHRSIAFDLNTADVLEMEYERRIGRR